MSIAITEEHQALAEVASEFLLKHDVRGVARTLLEAPSELVPPYWDDLVGLGWTGLHLPEAHGGSGYGMEELVVVIEELGRAVAPGSFVPSSIASAVIAATADEDTKARLLFGFADGTTAAGIGLSRTVSLSGGVASGSAVILGGGLAQLLVLAAGEDVAIVEVGGDGVTVDTPANLDPTRRSSRVMLDRTPVTVIPGAATLLQSVARLALSAEAVGLARECTEMGAAYAKERLQFGRVIGTYQAVKHHCANMAIATELATSAVWDAARASTTGGDQFDFAAAVAATVAAPAADLCANLSMQVHGGIAITWEHDAHLYLRRGTTLLSFLDADAAARDCTALSRRGIARARAIELPPEAELIRDDVRSFAQGIKDLSADEQRDRLIETGYVMPNWPKPYGREAGPIEQLTIEQEFSDAGIRRPQYGITAWNLLTLIQYANQEQLDRWVFPALRQEVIWCQLFSEPDAGSDAAGIKTKGTRVDGGWLINGQKVWTSGAHYSTFGLATIRTDPGLPKHEGITCMVIDMNAEGVEVRPLKMTTGDSEFNEVFFSDVFVPDDDVVGSVNGGWTVARATLGNESVSIGSGGGGGMNALTAATIVPMLDANPERLPGGIERVGRYIANHAAVGLLNLRSASRAVAATGPGPEGAITKLILSELGHESVAMTSALLGPEVPFMDGAARMSNYMVLMHRGMSIAGGTSEIKRNQIGERILGLPRDPLI